MAEKVSNEVEEVQTNSPPADPSFVKEADTESDMTSREIAVEVTAKMNESSDDEPESPSPQEEPTSEQEQVPEDAPIEDDQFTEDDGVEDDDGVEESSEEVSQSDWIEEGDVDLALSFGITSDDLQGLSGRDEYNRLVALMTRQEAGEFQQWSRDQNAQNQQPGLPYPPAPLAAPNAPAAPPVAPPVAPPLVAPAGVAAPVQTQAPVAPDGPGVKDGKVDVAYFEKGDYDEATLMMVRSLRHQQDTAEQQQGLFEGLTQAFGKLEAQHSNQMQEITNQQKQQYAIEEVNHFHDVMDSLRPDFYGLSVGDDGKDKILDSVHSDRRSQLGEGIRAVQDMISRKERIDGVSSTTSYATIVRRAERLVFGDELQAAERKKQSDKLRKQSRRRRPVSRSKSVTKSTQENNELTSREIANKPEIKEFTKKAREESGLID